MIMFALCCDFSYLYIITFDLTNQNIKIKFNSINLHLLNQLELIINMSRQFIYIPIPPPFPQKNKLDKIFRYSLHMYQSLYIHVSNVLVWVSKYNVCKCSVFRFSPRHNFLLLFCTVTVHELPPSQNHHALVSMLQRDSTHA